MQKGALLKRKQLRNLLWFILSLIFINLLFSTVSFRIDLTQDHRYTLTPATKKLLKNLKGNVRIKVFLKDKNLPADFRHFSTAIKNQLQDFNTLSNGRVHYEFVNPLAGVSQKHKTQIIDSLAQFGIRPYNISAQSGGSDRVTTQLLFPAALIDYQGHQIGINLLQQQAGSNPKQSLNYSTSLLEYNFAHTLAQLAQGKPPKVAYLLGNEETLDPTVYDALSILDQNYTLDTLNLKRTPSIPLENKAIVVMNPTTPFSKSEKIKLDQYIMQGGKVLWILHPAQASMDSLQNNTSFLAYDHGLNLEDLLFTYGVRVNADILQDLQSFSIPITVGSIGNRPQIQRLPWVFAPLLSPLSQSPITHNLNQILSLFPGSIDTTQRKDIQKRVLLHTSAHSLSLSTPLRISLEDIKTKPNPRRFTSKNLPVAVLLEGKFTSIYKNRLNATDLMNLQLASGKSFRIQSKPTQMIVVSDPNIFKNEVSKKDGPLPMGMDRYTREIFSNRDFFKNCLTYLTDTTGVILARNKSLSPQLLNTAKVEKDKNRWIALNFAIPFLFILLFGLIFQYIRKRKFVE